jgi:hypothetical protein
MATEVEFSSNATPDKRNRPPSTRSAEASSTAHIAATRGKSGGSHQRLVSSRQSSPSAKQADSHSNQRMNLGKDTAPQLVTQQLQHKFIS